MEHGDAQPGALGRHGWMVESLADLMVWAIGWSREDANKLL
jgi:hypothetical protein